jgi:hypothetical protein
MNIWTLRCALLLLAVVVVCARKTPANRTALGVSRATSVHKSYRLAGETSVATKSKEIQEKIDQVKLRMERRQVRDAAKLAKKREQELEGGDEELKSQVEVEVTGSDIGTRRRRVANEPADDIGTKERGNTIEKSEGDIRGEIASPVVRRPLRLRKLLVARRTQE